jgi:LacI family transcriptional regulator
LHRACHRRIGLISELEQFTAGDLKSFIDLEAQGRVDPGALYPSWQRLVSYLQAHWEAGITVDLDLVRRVGAYSAEAAKEETLDLLQGSGRATALFTTDGLMSAGAMNAISELALELPQDLSLICFDDLEWMHFLRPGITAIAQPLNEMGRTAARLILSPINGDPSPIQRQVPTPALRMRESAAGPKTQNRKSMTDRPNGRTDHSDLSPVTPCCCQRTSSSAGMSPASTAMAAGWPTAPVRVQVSAAA